MKKLLVIALLTYGLLGYSQEKEAWFDKHSFGLQIDLNENQVQEYGYLKDGSQNTPSAYVEMNFNYSFKGLYEYNFNNYFGVDVGLG